MSYFLYNPPLAYMILRVVVGFLFILHGYPKIKNFSSADKWFESVGMKPGKFWVSVAVAIEFFGGIALVLGLFVQLMGALIFVEMLVATWKVKWGKVGLVVQGGWELELLYGAAGLVLALTGGGMYMLL